MAEEQSAVFTDQLEISVAIGAFKNSLESAYQVYQEWMAKLGSQANDVLGVGLNSQIADLTTSVRRVAEDTLKAYQEMQQGISAVLEAVGAKEATLAAETIRLAQQVAKEKIKAAKEVEEEFKTSGPYTPYPPGRQLSSTETKGQEIQTDQEGELLRIKQAGIALVEKEAAARRKVAEDDLAAAEALYKVEQEKIALIEKEAAARRQILNQGTIAAEAAYKSEQERILLVEREVAARREILNQTLAAAEAAYKAEPKADTSAATKAEQERIALIEREAALRRSTADADIAAAEAAYKREIERLNLIEREAAARQQADQARGQLIVRARAEMERDFARRRELEESSNKGIMDGLVQQIGTVARLYIEWQLVMGAINAIGSAIKAPFDAIAQGVDYQKQAERSADELMGVMSSNVHYSENVAANFKEMRSNAEGAVKALQDIAIATNTPVDTVTRMFKSFIDNGITKYTTSMKDVLELTTMFAQGLKASGSAGMALNSQISNINTLMDGTVTSTNKFLKVLGLTPLEWQSILEKAREHGDLVAQLAPKMSKYTDALDEGSTHLARMQEQFVRITERIEAAGAQPLYTALTTGMKALSEWIDAHSPEIIAFLNLLSTLIAHFGEVLVRVLTNPLFVIMAKWLIGSFLLIVSAITNTIDTTVTGFRVANALIHGHVDEAKELLDQLGTRVNATTQAWIDMANAKSNVVTTPGGVALKPNASGGTSLGTPFHNDNADDKEKLNLEPFVNAVKEAKKAYQEASQNIQFNSDSSRKKVELDLAAGIISHRDAADKITDITSRELGARLARWQEYDQKFKGIVASIQAAHVSTSKEQDAKDKEVDNLTDAHKADKSTLERQQVADNNKVLEAIRAANTEEVSIRKAHVKALLALRAEQAKEELAIVHEQAKAGYLSALQVADAESEISKKEHDLRVAAIQSDMRAIQGSSGQVPNTREYSRLNNELIAEDQKYTASVKLNGAQRNLIAEQETTKRAEYYDKLRSLAIEASTVVVEIDTLLSGQTGYTSNQEKLFAIRQMELEQLQSEKTAQFELAAAKNSESEQTRKLTLDLQSLANQRMALFGQQLQAIQSSTSNPVFQQILERAAASKMLTTATNERDNTANDLASFRSRVNAKGFSTNADGKELEILSKRAQDAADALTKVQVAVLSATPSFGNAVKSFTKELTGFSTEQIKKAWSAATTPLEKFGVAVNVGAGALAQLGNVINAWKQGSAQGGTLGGVGAVMNNFMGALSAIPVVGQFMPAVAGVLSFVGQMFTEAAKRIAEDVKKEFQKTLDAYSHGNATLIDTLSAIEAERQSAIRQLSGKKGGQDQLNQLLPQFDNEIASLKKQQKDIVAAFEDSLFGLQQHSDTLSQVVQQWVQINKQVKDYVGAGGDAAKAAELLSLQLQQLQKTSQDQLDQGQQTAVKDAIQLNDLLQQRLNLVKQFNQQQFDLINGDAIERRQSGAVTRAVQLATLQQQYQQQLDGLDQQITLTNQKVDAESKIFTLATNINDLHRQDDALTLSALNQQIQKWTDLKTLIASIQNNGGVFSSSNPVFGAGINVQITFTGPVTASSADEAAQYGDTISQEISRQMRQST